ncbi:MAG: EthD family reductase [Chloroflexota bacterium]
MKTAVIIPALNEAGNIADLVGETRSQPVAQVIVVDNGSTDGTGDLALAAGARVVTEPRRGYGYACAAGAAAALAEGMDVLVFLDGDFSMRPAEIPTLLAPILDGRADLVLGSRALGHVAPAAMPVHQRLGNWLAAGLLRWLYRLPLTDLSPYRAIRAGLLGDLAMEEMTYGWPTEMMVKAARRGARIVEVPASFHPRRAGQSKVSGTLRGAFLAAYRILSVTLRHAWRWRIQGKVLHSWAMVKFVTIYRRVEEEMALEEFFNSQHLPLAEQLPDLRRREVGRVIGKPGGESRFHLSLELYFDSQADMERALVSPAGLQLAQILKPWAEAKLITWFFAEVFEEEMKREA